MSAAKDSFMGWPIRDLTMGEVLRQAAARHGEKTYLTALASGRTYSFRDVDGKTNALARGLASAGLRRGQHVALLMDNSDELLLLYFALGKLGAVVVPLNPAARGEQLGYYLDLCDVEAAICDAAHMPQLVERLPSHPKVSLVVSRGPFHAGGAPAGVEFIELDAVRGTDESPFDNGVRFTDPACLALTSGTTGPSKAILYTQATMMLVSLSNATAFGYTGDDVYYICLPLFHTSGLRGAAYVMLLTGGSVALARRFSVSQFWTDIKASGATTFDLLGAMASFLWVAPAQPAERDHRVRLCRIAPVPAFGRDFEARFNTRIVSTYGLTDGGAPAAFSLHDRADKFGSCGRERPGWKLRIADEDDFALPAGAVGEIQLRAEVPWLAPGEYYSMADSTVAAWRNGWFHTGDRGYIDGDGYLFFTERQKDVIRRRGENISAWEVENALTGHPDVVAAAVFAVVSKFGEDELAACVTLRPGAGTTAAELVEHCRQRLMPFMVPGLVEILSEFPTTPTQRIDKNALRQLIRRK